MRTRYQALLQAIDDELLAAARGDGSLDFGVAFGAAATRLPGPGGVAGGGLFVGDDNPIFTAGRAAPVVPPSVPHGARFDAFGPPDLGPGFDGPQRRFPFSR